MTATGCDILIRLRLRDFKRSIDIVCTAPVNHDRYRPNLHETNCRINQTLNSLDRPIITSPPPGGMRGIVMTDDYECLYLCSHNSKKTVYSLHEHDRAGSGPGATWSTARLVLLVFYVTVWESRLDFPKISIALPRSTFITLLVYADIQ